ncbi:FAD-dependent oxidoreductase [Candidatus Fermentibacteria bacterium]|nr:FAD-dependent oxidoreductase [Candidatus Fermentibacteria bacterium]
MDRIRLTINGREIEARPGQTILEVVREQGLDDIPTLCHSPELEPYGSCFVCVVELKGRPNLVPSCATRVAPGMEVETGNERVRASRKTALELLLSNHYADCLSPCKLGCPAGVDAQGYIALAAMGEYRKAVDLIRENNPLPAVCGRVCVRKCEVVCRRADVDSPVGINAVKRFVTDAPGIYDGGVECAPPNGKSVGIVGGGPAGLSAGWFLGRKGYRVVVYEMMEKAGGMVRYGIPVYRLTDETLDAEIDHIRKAGVEILTGVRVGRDISLAELRKRHDAVFIAAGAWAGNPMRVEGEFDTEGVVNGIDFLREKYYDRTPISGTVVVVGGGNTAMDVARTAWRLDADKVILLYRRTKAEMPADPMEIEESVREGVEIMELAAPVGIVSEGGRLKALKCIRMKLGEPDASGRKRPVPLEGSEFDLPCRMAVSAIGQSPLLEGLVEDGPRVTKWGTVSVDTATMKTDVEGVFCGGDVADDGPTVVIDAIADGRTAALSIHSWLSGEPVPRPFVARKDLWAKPGKAELGDIRQSPRHEVEQMPVEQRRGSFAEVATGFDYEDMMHEGERCLSCGCLRFDDCDLRLRAEEYGVDMSRYFGQVRKHRIDDRHPHIVYDPNKCILCGRCIRTCARVLPVAALGLVGRGFRTEMRPAMNDPLVETNCVSCGNCVDSCPTGALTVKFPFPGRACLEYESADTHCSLCSLLCPVEVRSFGRERYFVKSPDRPGEYLCRYGRFVNELYIRQKRVPAAFARRGSSLVQVDVCEAAREAVEGLRRVAAAHGPGSVAVFVSPESTSEQMYLAGLVAREVLGTGNVGSLAEIVSGSSPAVLDGILGFTASTAGREAAAGADLVICSNTSLESDHPVMVVDVLDAVRKNHAGLLVVNSILDQADRAFGSASMDPMRGRASILWAGIVQALIERGVPAKTAVSSMEGGPAFLSALDFPLERVAAETGVDADVIRSAVDIIADAGRIAVVHSMDRARDRAPGDTEILADLVLLLRKAGVQADLLLLRTASNAAALATAGADPAFSAGRARSPKLPGAADGAELAALLSKGGIRGALVIGEDPLREERTAGLLGGLEYLAVMDWAQTETTRAADILLPGTTGLEEEGTRVGFDGRVRSFAQAVRPPSGLQGWEILREMLPEGLRSRLRTSALVTEDLERLVAGHAGRHAGMYWRTGDSVPGWDGTGHLVMPAVTGRSSHISVPMTAVSVYKATIREVGTERFRIS